MRRHLCILFFFFQAEDGIRDLTVTGVQTCALPIYLRLAFIAVAALGGIFCIAGLAVFYSPLLNHDAITGGAIFNSLIPGYLLPAIFAAVLARFSGPVGAIYQKAAGAAALALGLAYCVLEARTLLRGPLISLDQGTSLAEVGI